MLLFPKQRLIFFHVPKCAGVSVYRSLKTALNIKPRSAVDKLLNVHNMSRVHDHWHSDKERAREFRHAKRARLVTGHFGWGTYEEIGPREKDVTFTFLREPQERLLSLHRFICSEQGKKWVRTSEPLEQMELAEFLNYKHQDLDWQMDNVLVRMFSGGFNDKIESGSEWANAVDRAKSNIDKLTFIGFQNTFGRDLEKLHDIIGLKAPSGINWENKTLEQKQTVSIDSADQGILDKFTQHDKALYRHAVENYQ